MYRRPAVRRCCNQRGLNRSAPQGWYRPPGRCRRRCRLWYTSTEDDTITEGSGANEDQNTESEYADTEVINESSHQEDHEAKTVHQSVFINNGSGIQIGVNYGEINLSPRRNEKGG